MALPPGGSHVAEPRALRRYGRVDVTRRALLDGDPDVGADVARVPRMDIRHVTTHVHRTKQGRVTESERIVLSARRSCADKSHRPNGGDSKEASQLPSVRESEKSPANEKDAQEDPPLPLYSVWDKSRSRTSGIPQSGLEQIYEVDLKTPAD